MGETLYGDWSVIVASTSAVFDERFVIAGSASSDRDYPGVPGTGPGPVSGAAWTITAQWNDNQGSGWRPSVMRRSATYTVANGLEITLRADDNYDNLRDGDFNDLVIVCLSLDPSLALPQPTTNPYDFTVSKEVFGEYTKDHDDRDRDRGDTDHDRQESKRSTEKRAKERKDREDA